MKRSNTHHTRPRIEPLESIAPPTSGLGALTAPAAIVATNIHGPKLSLIGAIHGEYKELRTIPDVGGKQSLVGSGSLLNLGHPSLKGTLYTPGFTFQGHATATLTLTNVKGTINVRLLGPVEPGFGGPPSTFTYTITGGTGRYVGAHGGGNVGFVETGPTSGPFTMKFH